VLVELHTGDRAALRPLFELAEDSSSALDSYLESGRVLIVREGARVIGHLQLTETGAPGELEIKNMAVLASEQQRGVGRSLIDAALRLAREEGCRHVRVATAAADVGNLRFYQRCGFRLRSIERDAFTPATGYPPGTMIDGIELRDRIWLDIVLVDAPA
jgi:ribosomal protein S18 acetylase RimI-like enzyme